MKIDQNVDICSHLALLRVPQCTVTFCFCYWLVVKCGVKCEWVCNYLSLFLARNLFSTGQDRTLNTEEDSMIVGKKRCSWERRKENNEERERTEKEKDADAKEHKCASLQQPESFTQQRLKYCHSTGTHSHTILHFTVFFTLINCEYIHLSLSLHRRIKRNKDFQGFIFRVQCFCMFL